METNNKLIAEFAGYKLENKKYQYQHFHSSNESCWEWDEGVIVTLDGHEVSGADNEPIFDFDELPFEEDWNLLIGVLKKIREISNVKLTIDDYDKMKSITKYLNPYDYEIDFIYEKVIEFIKWYNNEKS
mgnify:CR=1 FL=1